MLVTLDDLFDLKKKKQDRFETCLEIFQEHVLHFLKATKTAVGDECMTSKMHSFAHVILDLRKFRTQLYANSAYPFETSVQRFRGWLRSGNKPLHQIRLVFINPPICAHVICHIT